MMANFGIFVMVIVLPLKNVYGCIPTRNIDDTGIIPLTTTPPPPPPCSSCLIPLKTVDDNCGLTMTPCDENNRSIFDCGSSCILFSQNEPTDVLINRGTSPVDIICDSSSGRFFIGTPTDQIRTVRCA
uniref:Uncharacterized protein n=1 Tax=Panagrolaimus davidi TaxID=227884 RepID=A0A914P6H5_9BILA